MYLCEYNPYLLSSGEKFVPILLQLQAGAKNIRGDTAASIICRNSYEINPIWLALLNHSY